MKKEIFLKRLRNKKRELQNKKLKKIRKFLEKRNALKLKRRNKLNLNNY